MSDYFKHDELAYDVWKAKYQQNEETVEQFFSRLSNNFYREFKYHDSLSEYGKKRLDEPYDKTLKTLFEDFKYVIPGGSVLAGIGTDKPVSLSNCYVIGTEDSVSEIFDTAKQMANIYKRRGGVGTDMSELRPRGALVNNASNTTTGVVPFMELFSQTTNTIGQEGRRGALMISLDIRHPDSPEFAVCKRDLTKITGANISLKVSKDFMDAVEKDEDYILRWPVDLEVPELREDLEYNELEPLASYGSLTGYVKKIRAKELWDTIIESNWKSAEPGILFWDNIIDYDPASVYPEYKAISTNPCGEIPLSSYDACRLIAVNVYNLVTSPFTEKAHLDEDLVYKVFYEAQVIADTLVDIELKHIERIIALKDEQEFWKKVYEIGKNGRRTGTGITALGDMCAALGVSYGDPETVEKLMSLKLKAELDASIDLAVVEGAFPAWDSSKEFDELSFVDFKGKNDWYKFIVENYPDQAFKMSLYGRRNISLSTIAPTGSLSILAGTSSGCEPVFSLYYMRRKKCNSGETPDFIDQNGVGFKNYMVIHPKFRDWYKIKFEEELTDTSEENLNRLYEISPWFNQTANDLTPLQRIETQSILQKYTTHSISSTVNLPEDVSMDTVNELYRLGYKMNLKGLTTYRAGSRSGILVNANEKVISKERPNELPCKVLRFKNERKNWIAFVGIKDDRPYEIFTGINDLDEFPIPSYVEEGVIIKVPGEDRSRYDFRYVDNYGYTNTLGGLNRIFNKEYWNYARFVSALLREGTPLQNIVNIIEKLEFSNKSLNNWQFGIIRCLKSFISDGTKSEEACPECGEHTIVYENGCKTCKSCGDSKCN
jgi:ribonucleoside-diphosphate reductase alpha chain